MILLRACNYWVKLTKASSVRQNTCRILVLMLKETSLRTNLPWSCTANSSPSPKKWFSLVNKSSTTEKLAYHSDSISTAPMKAIPTRSQSLTSRSPSSHILSHLTLNHLTSLSQRNRRRIRILRSLPPRRRLRRARMIQMLRLPTASTWRSLEATSKLILILMLNLRPQLSQLTRLSSRSMVSR